MACSNVEDDEDDDGGHDGRDDDDDDDDGHGHGDGGGGDPSSSDSKHTCYRDGAIRIMLRLRRCKRIGMCTPP